MTMRFQILALSIAAALTGAACSSKPAEQSAAQPATTPSTAKPALNIKPFGTADPNFKPDYSSLPPELQKTFAHIDSNIDSHVETYRKWLQQPSISNSGEGIPESAEMV